MTAIVFGGEDDKRGCRPLWVTLSLDARLSLIGKKVAHTRARAQDNVSYTADEAICTGLITLFGIASLDVVAFWKANICQTHVKR